MTNASIDGPLIPICCKPEALNNTESDCNQNVTFPSIENFISICDPTVTAHSAFEYLMIIVGNITTVLSLSSLLATFIVYSILPELRNLHGLTIHAYVGCLFVSQAFMVLAEFGTLPHKFFSGAYLNLFSLAEAFWLNVMCFDIWSTFRKMKSSQGRAKRKDRKRYVWYSIYAWGNSAFIFIMISLVSENGNAPFWFSVPIVLTMIANAYFFVSTAVNIIRQRKNATVHLDGSENQRHNDEKKWFKLYLTLFFLMGLSETIEIMLHIITPIPSVLSWLIYLPSCFKGCYLFEVFVYGMDLFRICFDELRLVERSKSQCRTALKRETLGIHSRRQGTKWQKNGRSSNEFHSQAIEFFTRESNPLYRENFADSMDCFETEVCWNLFNELLGK